MDQPQGITPGRAKLLPGDKTLGLDQFPSGHIPQVAVERRRLPSRHDPKPPDLVPLTTQVLAIPVHQASLAPLQLIGLAVGRDKGPLGVLLLNSDGIDARPVCS